MWIASTPKAFGITFCLGLFIGFALGSHAHAQMMLPMGHESPMADPVPLPAPIEIASYGYDAASQTVTLWGPIGPETPLMLDYKIRSNGWTVKWLALNSPGGSLKAAKQLAAMVAINGWGTYAMNCSSACPVVWSAGVNRALASDAYIGVHEARAAASSWGDYSIEGTKQVIAWYAAHGAPQHVLDETRWTPSSGIYPLTRGEMEQWANARHVGNANKRSLARLANAR